MRERQDLRYAVYTDGCLYNALLPEHEVLLGSTLKKYEHYMHPTLSKLLPRSLSTPRKSEVSKLIRLSFSPWALAHRGRQSFQRIPESRWLIEDPKPYECSRKRYKNIKIGKERIPWISLDVVEVAGDQGISNLTPGAMFA